MGARESGRTFEPIYFLFDPKSRSVRFKMRKRKLLIMWPYSIFGQPPLLAIWERRRKGWEY